MLAVIALLTGIMPFENREIKADVRTKEITINVDDTVYVDIGMPYTEAGITLSGDIYGDTDAENASLYVGDIIICHGEFTFSSSIGKISKIAIYTEYDTGFFPTGWTWNGETLTWEGEPSYSVTIENESKDSQGRYDIGDITKIVFTVIVEDVTDISLSEKSFDLPLGETKTLTATFEPSTATEKKVFGTTTLPES
ncbi:MAG: hypothetical protein K5908_03620 [Erysipelotrichaceae bacterium]|nr:hypothetical protein [Erysipelotrichaceae bacterium]